MFLVFLAILRLELTHVSILKVNSILMEVKPLFDVVWYIKQGVPSDPADDGVSPLCFRYFANEPFADLHRVEGLRGVFIATLINGSVSEDNMRSVITFDKGGTWELLQPPAADSLGGTVDCQVPPTNPHIFNDSRFLFADLRHWFLLVTNYYDGGYD